MKDISYGSKKKLIWECGCNHNNIWICSPLQRTHNKIKYCPECSRLIAQSKKFKSLIYNGTSITLYDWCKQNNLYGDRLIKEWVGKDTHGNDIDMNDVSYGSTLKVMWRHLDRFGDEHIWVDTIHSRTLNKSLCPYCNNKGTSLNEQIIYRAFKQLFDNTVSRDKFQGYEFDITVPELNLCIEYGSTYYHNGREQRDKEKEELCRAYKINFIRIIDDSNYELDELFSEHLIIARLKTGNTKIIEVINYIFNLYNLDSSKVDLNKAIRDSINFMQS